MQCFSYGRGISSLSVMWQLIFCLVLFGSGSAVASLLFARRNANMAGDFAGRPKCFSGDGSFDFTPTLCYCTAWFIFIDSIQTCRSLCVAGTNTSTFTLHSRRGTHGSGRALVAQVPVSAAASDAAGVTLGDICLPFCVAGVALTDIHLHFPQQAWHFWQGGLWWRSWFPWPRGV